MAAVLSKLTNAFPIWVFACSVIALIHPPIFTWFDRELIILGLGVIMLGMGVTLKFEDVKRVFKLPKAIGAGLAAQFTIMPFLGWSLAYVFQLETELAVGLILVSCCPGGTASNVVAYLAKANVALSVLMTMCSTFAAVFMTPLLTKWLAGTLIEVDAYGLFKSTVQIVLLPVVAGIVLNQYWAKTVRRFLPVFPLISVIFITLIVASIIGQKKGDILQASWTLIAAPFALHALAFLLGYLSAKILGYEEEIRRTVSIEVGMQNSGLGTALAAKHFPDTLAAVPCVISSVYHCLIGSFLASRWRKSIPPLPNE